ncbi:MAG TPA: precorrin-8X methylmutase [Spirochaeta sp.]|nr:precorrin-8X methylmutase [Spirochaeta sp.]
MTGPQITSKSFSIIRNRLGSFTAPSEVMEIVIRIAHTTGDVDFATTFDLEQEAVAAGVQALKNGAPVITDVEMVRTGVRKPLLHDLGGQDYCFLNDPEVVEKVKGSDTTRSALAMEKAGEILNGAVVAIGNAPTALFKLMEMTDASIVKPALIIGVPVGFVGALESKEELATKNYNHITNLSERGGSTIAAAIVNGLLALASDRAGRS